MIPLNVWPQGLPPAVRAAVMMVAASACFVANDALMKLASQSIPASQLIFLRSACVVVLLLLLAQRRGELGHLPDLAKKPVLLRSVTDAGGTALYLISLFHLPLPNATAINQGAPLFMTLLAVLFLRERASALRWAAVLMGFAGVWLVAQPSGDGFNAWAWMCLAGTMLHAARDLLTRRLGTSIPTLIIALSGSLTLGLLAAIWLLADGQWQPVSVRNWSLILLSAALLCSAFLLLIACLRLGEISFTAPLRYTGLLFAVLIGFVVWGDQPSGWAWGGIALLMGSGLMVFTDSGAGLKRR